MESAPASIPPITLVDLATGFGEPSLSRSSRRSCRSADWASRSAGTRPAADTRFGSSKSGRIA